MTTRLSGYDVCRAIRKEDAALPILMLNAAWGIDYQGTTRTLDPLTVHGYGYRYRPE